MKSRWKKGEEGTPSGSHFLSHEGFTVHGGSTVGNVFDIMRDLDVGHFCGMVEGLDIQGRDGAGTA